MAVDSTTASTTTSTSTTASASSLASLSQDYEAFLKLLTAQISNQDPLAPMDSTEFVSQLAQLSQVEQSVQANSQLESIVASLSAAASLSGVNLIGRDVTVETSQLGMADGASSFSYALDSTAATARAVITDSSGNAVRTISDLAVTGGTLHDVSWDGLDDAGNLMEDGTYNVQIVATDSAGSTVSGSTYAAATVQGVVMAESGAMLRLGNGTSVDMSAILAVN
ncbi:flagellar hook assembly protein FlgD [Frigidibacter sp. MR17.24]|uniref:flagellar hook assembly protein FlgD n=1 Tax=Frigidibacter sp. MR17.24 TaxID=3127345 RepID=UPI00301317CB